MEVISDTIKSETTLPQLPPPRLRILIQPQSKFRFRYKSEMSGKHGSILGGNLSKCEINSESFSGSIKSHSSSSSSSQNLSTNGSKVYPTVKLENYSGNEAFIRCSLVSDSSPYYPHPYILEMSSRPQQLQPPSVYNLLQREEESEGEEDTENNTIQVSSQNNYTAVYQGLNIICVGRKYLKKQLIQKITKSYYANATKDQIEDLYLNLNLNKVLLCFEAFRKNPDNSLSLICPPIYSHPIENNKSTQTGNLRIIRIDKHTSCCTGGEEIFLLVEKVNKHNIQVKFFQENEKGHEIWKAYGQFSKLDVHHQYAIVFKTPPYRSIEIDEEIEVNIQLERPSDGSLSQSIPFKYKPIERIRKMPKRLKSRGDTDNSDKFCGSDNAKDGQENSGANSQENKDTNNFQGHSAGSSSVKQGSSSGPIDQFPCEAFDESGSNKNLALSVALSVSQGLSAWAATSNFNFILKKLRHLLCLVDDNGENALHTAIQNKQMEPFMTILNLISSFDDINYIINETNLKGLTPISQAVLTPNASEFVQELINHNADLTIVNLDGDNPIHLAVKEMSTENLKCLLRAPSASIVINKFNYSCYTPLHLSVFLGNLEATELLCNSKVILRPQEGNKGNTCLHLAIESENLQAAIIILKAAKERDKQLVNVQNYGGDTSLHISASKGLIILCALLLYFGADPNIQNFMKKDVENENENEEEEEVGQNVFQVANNEKILKVLNGSFEDWGKIIKDTCNLLQESQGVSVYDIKLISSLDSIHFDSGIDIKDLNV